MKVKKNIITNIRCKYEHKLSTVDADATASVQNMVHGLEDKIKKDC